MTSRNRHFLTDAAIYGIGGVVIQLASVALLPLYTHCLAPADYGVMEVIERIGEIINICLMTTGVRQAAFAFYLQSKSQADREQVAITISSFVLGIFLLAGLAVVVASPVLAPHLGIGNPWLLVFGVISVLAELFLVVPLCMMQARVESVAFATLSVLMLVTRIGLAIVFVAIFRWGLWGVYGSLLITFLPFGLALTWRELKKGSPSINWTKCGEIARFSLPFIPSGICFFILYNGDRFFLVGSAGAAALGIYALGCKIASIAGTVAWQPLFKVWSARMYEVFAKPDGSLVAGHMLTRLLAGYAFVATGLGLFHREALSILSSRAYADAGPVIGPIMLANGFMLASNFMEGVFYYYRKTHWKPWTALVAMIAILVLYAILIPRYSIFGAVYASMFGYLTMALVTYVVAQHVFRVRYEWLKIGFLVASSTAVYWASSRLDLGIVQFMLKCALMIGWIGAICVAGVVPAEDRRLAISLLNRLRRFGSSRPQAEISPQSAAETLPEMPVLVISDIAGETAAETGAKTVPEAASEVAGEIGAESPEPAV